MSKARISPSGGVTVKLLLALLVLFLALVLVDFVRFFRDCEQFAARATLGTAILSEKVIPQEVVVVLTGYHRRIPKALELLRLRRSPLLIISGAGKGVTLKDLVNQQEGSSTKIHEIWKKIIVESQSASTIENATEIAKIVKERQLQRIVLVTSDYHMRRSLMVFKKLLPNLEYLEYPVDSGATDFSAPFSHRHLDALWRLFIEFWKYFLFKHYVIYQLPPA